MKNCWNNKKIHVKIGNRKKESNHEENTDMENIFHRVSIRKYQDRPVEREKIVEILRAAMAAPSAKNQQPWEFYVITKKDTLEKLSKASP